MSVPKKSQAGFTMIELLVAVVILAIGLLGLVQLQVTALKANSQGMTSTAATALAQKVVEEIAALPADDAMFNGPSSGNTWSVTPIMVDGGGTYEIIYDVDEVFADPDDAGTQVSNLYKITITVTSTTKVASLLGNQERQVVATTFKRAI